jgi:PAS domain-containing protein
MAESVDTSGQELENLSKEQLISLVRQQRQIHDNQLNTLRLLIENTSDMVLCIDRTMRIVAYNKPYAEHIKNYMIKKFSKVD